MSDTPSETAPMKPALTAEEWARRFHSIQCYDSWSEEQSEKTGVGEISADLDYLRLTSHQHSEIANFSAPSDRHALAALALYGQPFGFTWDDVATLARHIDLSDDLYADPALMSFIRRLKALLPPEPSDHKPTVHRGGLADLPRLFEEELNRKL